MSRDFRLMIGDWRLVSGDLWTSLSTAYGAPPPLAVLTTWQTKLLG